MDNVFLKRIYLNLRALRLALTGTWLRASDVAHSYDTIAASYDENWLVHLQGTTDALHETVAKFKSSANAVLELGCGSGYSTEWLLKQYSEATIDANDISPEMIAKAKKRTGESRARFHCGDMLELLKRQKTDSLDLVFSGWAIGYSQPAVIIAEAARVLKSEGVLAVIVNRLDTMPAVFEAFKETMRTFPESLEKALWPRFPKNKSEIVTLLEKSRLKIETLEDGAVPIAAPSHGRLDWLQGTGVLAGFDAVLPLREPGPVREHFAEKLDATQQGWEHHYLLFIARKTVTP